MDRTLTEFLAEPGGLRRLRFSDEDGIAWIENSSKKMHHFIRCDEDLIYFADLDLAITPRRLRHLREKFKEALEGYEKRKDSL